MGNITPKERSRLWRENNRERHREYSKQYVKDHQRETIEYRKKYRQTLIGFLRRCFHQMRERCNNSKNKDYKNYGGRGIKCLFESADEFIDYVVNTLEFDTFEKIKKLQIDRIDNNGHYESGNIRFTTAKINANNRRKRKC